MRKLKGTIVSDKMVKTVLVEVSKIKVHPKYHKRFKVSKRFKAHDGENKFKNGDIVIIQETKPMSKEKRWKVVELIKRHSEVDEKENIT